MKKVKLTNLTKIDEKHHQPLLEKLNDINIGYYIKKGTEVWVDSRDFVMAATLMLRLFRTK